MGREEVAFWRVEIVRLTLPHNVVAARGGHGHLLRSLRDSVRMTGTRDPAAAIFAMRLPVSGTDAPVSSLYLCLQSSVFAWFSLILYIFLTPWGTNGTATLFSRSSVVRVRINRFIHILPHIRLSSMNTSSTATTLSLQFVLLFRVCNHWTLIRLINAAYTTVRTLVQIFHSCMDAWLLRGSYLRLRR
jgi:hypothetical protein